MKNKYHKCSMEVCCRHSCDSCIHSSLLISEFPCNDCWLISDDEAKCYYVDKSDIVPEIPGKFQSQWNTIERVLLDLEAQYSNHRIGQNVFDAVYICDPKAARALAGTIDDCYYDDSKIKQFKLAIETIWNKDGCNV